MVFDSAKNPPFATTSQSASEQGPWQPPQRPSSRPHPLCASSDTPSASVQSQPGYMGAENKFGISFLQDFIEQLLSLKWKSVLNHNLGWNMDGIQNFIIIWCYQPC